MPQQNPTTTENPAQTATQQAQSAAQRASRTITETASQVAQQAERWNANRRKPIDTRMHGMLDYTLSPTLMLSPNVFGFPTSGAAGVVPRTYGAASMVYSALTRYDLGIQPLIPMRTHLILDAVSSLFMAVSPWVRGSAAAAARARGFRTWHSPLPK